MPPRTDADIQDQLRRLPSVDQVLRSPAFQSLLHESPASEVTHAVRAALDQCRTVIRSGRSIPDDLAALALQARRILADRRQPHLRRVINATGIVLHTGLGRAPLAAEAIEAVIAVAAGYCNLEIDLESGDRGDRHSHVRALLSELTGAEDALVLNNNAGATFLALKALAENRDVIISRGQLVEIGGSYRMPDVMAAAGCRMLEVGTTNRTRIADYQRAITPDTAALLRVHTSNYRIAGFSEETPLNDLVALSRSHSPPLPVIDDLGSGLLDANFFTSSTPESGKNGSPIPATREPANTWDEPSVRDSVASGASLTLFSGDKLLGGPQAGIIVGQTALIAAIRAHPLTRALRPDKLTLAALEATLRLYRDPAALARRLPTARMLAATPAELESVARTLVEHCARIDAEMAVVAEVATSFAGGGALPTVELPTWIVRLQHPRLSAQHLAAALRTCSPPVVARIQSGALILDCRTLAADELKEVVGAVAEAIREVEKPAVAP